MIMKGNRKHNEWLETFSTCGKKYMAQTKMVAMEMVRKLKIYFGNGLSGMC